MKCEDGWELRSLSALADYINGFAFKPDDWGDEGLPIIRIEQLKNPDAPTDYFDGRLAPANVIDDGDLIFSWSASLFLRIWTHGRAALNQHLFKVVEREHVDRLFLKTFIEFYLPELTRASHGSTMQHITRKELDRFTAPFPVCDAEQSKIADVLSTVDRAIEQTEALVAKQQRIKTGLMQDLLTGGIDEQGNLRTEQTHEFKDSPLGRIPVEWDVLPLGEITEKIADRDHTTPKYVEDGVLMISPMAFKNDEDIDFGRCPRITRSAHLKNSKKTDSRVGDIILHRIGAGLGRVREVGSDHPEYSLLHSLALVRPASDRAGTKYLKWSFRSPYLQNQMGLGTQSIGVPDLGLDKIGALLFKVPTSLDEQRQIGVVLDSLQHHVEKLRNSVSKITMLRTGLMQDLLTGNRRVHTLLGEKVPA